MAKVVADSLRVRSKPEISAASTKLTPLLDAPLKVAVLAGPVSASGYDWYLIESLKREIWFQPTEVRWGWVAAASRQGEPWIRQVAIDCPAKPTTLAELGALDGFIGWLCFGGEPITIRAQILHSMCDIYWGGRARPSWFNPVEDVVLDEPGTRQPDSESCRFPVVHPDTRLPAGGLRSLIGQTARITGMFDHPAARKCTFTPWDEEPVGPPEGAIGCRETFVITRIRR